MKYTVITATSIKGDKARSIIESEQEIRARKPEEEHARKEETSSLENPEPASPGQAATRDASQCGSPTVRSTVGRNTPQGTHRAREANDYAVNKPRKIIKSEGLIERTGIGARGDDREEREGNTRIRAIREVRNPGRTKVKIQCRRTQGNETAKSVLSRILG